MARAAVPRLTLPSRVAGAPLPAWALAGAAYLGVLLLADRYASHAEQVALGLLTWAVVAAVLASLPRRLAVLSLGVIAFATAGEIVGSIVWGVYTYRLENLPLFVPPAHAIVYLTGLAVALSLRRHARALVAVAAAVAVCWAVLGLTVLPRLDVAGAAGVVLLVAFLVRSSNGFVYAGVFLVVAALEVYGTAIGTWRWAPELPGTGIPNGNPPSGVASGYVWFDVMALLVAPHALRLVASLRRGARTAGGLPPGERPRTQPQAEPPQAGRPLPSSASA